MGEKGEAMRSYPIPKTSEEFERTCLKFLSARWSRPNLVLYGKSGQSQSGVDIVDLTQPLDVYAAQCKLHEQTKVVSKAELEAEIAKAKKFNPPIRVYAFCTTARKHRESQDWILEINASHVAEGSFRVDLIFWEDIETFLDQHQELWEELNVVSAASIRTVVRTEMIDHRVLAAVAQAAALHSTGTTFDEQLDQAKRLLDEGQFDAAEPILRELKDRKFDRLSPLQRYRCLANLSVVFAMRGDEIKSAELLLSACDAYPDHERAMANRALALGRLGDDAGAWRVAQDAVRKYPGDVHTAAIYASSAPSDVSTADIRAALSPAVQGDPEFVLALGNRELIAARYDAAIELARLAAEDPKFEAFGAMLRGRALLDRAAPSNPRDAAHVALDVPTLNAALEAFSAAATSAERSGHVVLAIDARLHEIDAARLLDRIDSMETAIDSGLALARQHPAARSRFLHARSELRAERGDNRAAFRDADAAVELAPDSIDLIAYRESCRWNLGDDASRELARRELLGLIDRVKGPTLEQLVTLAVRACITTRKFNDARGAIERAKARGLAGSIVACLGARVALQEGNENLALADSRAAASLLNDESSLDDVEAVAQTLMSLKRHDVALPFLQRFASTTALTTTTRLLIHCAQVSQSDEILMALCSSLREARVRDRSLLDIEFGVLQRYAPQRALDLVEEATAVWPEDRTIRVMRCHIGHVLRRPELMKLDPADVPTAAEVEPRLVPAIVGWLSESGFVQEAAEYAYRCLHRFPDELSIHIAFVRSVLLVKGTRPWLDDPLTVTMQCAVEYQVEGRDRTEWMVIDDSVPRSMPDVRHSNAALPKALVGKSTGDRGELAPGESRVVVKKIRNKYLYRLHAVLDRLQIDFPGESPLKQFGLKNDPITGQPDFQPWLDLLKSIELSTKQILDVYRTGFLSVESVAAQINRPVFATMEHIANDPTQKIHCAFVDEKIFAQALGRLRGCPGLVPDATAIATLRMLGLEQILTKIPCQIGYVAALLAPIHDEATSRDNESESVGTMIHHEGKLVFAPRSAEVTEKEKARWAGIVGAIRGTGGVLDSMPLAGLDKKLRTEAEELIGATAAESAAAAKGASYLLWSDDSVNGFVANAIFGVDRVWTQTVLAWLVEQGKLTNEEYDRASARLLAFGYTGARFASTVLVEAGRLAEWSPGDEILRRNLSVLATLPATACLEHLVAYATAVSREVQLTVTKDALFALAVSAIRYRPEAAAIIQAAMNEVRKRLRLDPLRAEDVTRALVAAARAHLADVRF